MEENVFKSTIKFLQTKQDEEWFVEERKDDMNEVLWTNEQATHCGMTLAFYGKLKLFTQKTSFN